MQIVNLILAVIGTASSVLALIFSWPRGGNGRHRK